MRGMGNMQGMQKQMQEAQESLNQQEFTGVSQSDMVKVTMTGERKITAVEIKAEAVDPEDVELLQDLVMMAVNNALENVAQANDSTMGQFTKGLNIPGF